MNCHNLISYNIALSVIVLTEVASFDEVFGQTILEKSEQLIATWPKEPRPRMTGKYIEVREDGPIEKRLRIDSGNHRFIFEDKRHWVFTKSRTPRYSIILQDRKIPELSFGISRFGSGEFLESLQDEYWLPYVASLEADIPAKTVTYEHYTVDSRERPYVLKNWTRKIEYEYPMGDGKIGKTREIFTFIDSDLFVFIFSGPKSSIESLRSSHDIFLTRMNLYSGS